MPFKKGTSGNPIGRPKGSVSTTTKLIREHISQSIDGNKIKEMLDKIDSPTEYTFKWGGGYGMSCKHIK